MVPNTRQLGQSCCSCEFCFRRRQATPGVAVLVAGVIAHWMSNKQAGSVASAHAAELNGACLGANAGISIRQRATELLPVQHEAGLRLDQYNKGAISSILHDITSWRTMHYADRASWMRNTICGAAM